MTGRPEEAEVQRAKRSMAALKVELPEGVWITHEEAMRPLFLAVAAQGRVIEAQREALREIADTPDGPGWTSASAQRRIQAKAREALAGGGETSRPPATDSPFTAPRLQEIGKREKRVAACPADPKEQT